MDHPPPLPVYLVHWNAPDWVRSATGSIGRSDLPVRTLVMTNSGPVDVPGAEVVDTGGNLGFTGGANRALAHWLAATPPTPYAVVGTHDLHVAPDSFRLMVEAMDDDPQLGLCAPSMPDAPRVPSRGEGRQDWLMGQCIMFRRACAEDLGGFDERFGTYGEDKDLCIRAWDQGWAVGVVEGAYAHGLGSISAKARPLRLGNEVGLARKHHGIGLALKLLAVQPLLALNDVRASLFDRASAADHLRYASDRFRSIPLGVRSFRRFSQP